MRRRSVDERCRNDGRGRRRTACRRVGTVMSLPRQPAVDCPRQVLRAAPVSADRARVRRVERPVSRSQRRQLQSQLRQVRR